MKNKILIILIIILNVSLFTAFEESISGIESKGMGDLKAPLKTVSAVNINPAISPFIQKLNIGFHSALETGIADEGIGIGIIGYSSVPIVKNKFALNAGVNYFGLTGIDYPNAGNIPYSESIISVGGGYAILENISIGISGKYQFWTLSAEKKISGLNGNNFNLCAGLYLNDLLNILSIGISADNILGGDVSSKGSIYEEKLPLKINFGLLYSFVKLLKLQIDTGFEVEYINGDNPTYFHFGGAFYLFQNKTFTLTAGMSIDHTFSNIIPTAGAKIKISNLNIMYSFQYPLVFMGSAGQHLLGVIMEI